MLTALLFLFGANCAALALEIERRSERVRLNRTLAEALHIAAESLRKPRRHVSHHAKADT